MLTFTETPIARLFRSAGQTCAHVEIDGNRVRICQTGVHACVTGWVDYPPDLLAELLVTLRRVPTLMAEAVS